MKAHTVSLINSLVLITMGLWGYLDSDSRPITALIPVIVGIVLLIIIGLVKPFLGTLDRGNIYGILRVSLMILTSLWAMITFIQSFISARKNKSK